MARSRVPAPRYNRGLGQAFRGKEDLFRVAKCRRHGHYFVRESATATGLGNPVAEHAIIVSVIKTVLQNVAAHAQRPRFVRHNTNACGEGKVQEEQHKELWQPMGVARFHAWVVKLSNGTFF